jgi:hypothetical protein
LTSASRLFRRPTIDGLRVRVTIGVTVRVTVRVGVRVGVRVTVEMG